MNAVCYTCRLMIDCSWDLLLPLKKLPLSTHIIISVKDHQSDSYFVSSVVLCCCLTYFSHGVEEHANCLFQLWLQTVVEAFPHYIRNKEIYWRGVLQNVHGTQCAHLKFFATNGNMMTHLKEFWRIHLLTMWQSVVWVLCLVGCGNLTTGFLYLCSGIVWFTLWNKFYLFIYIFYFLDTFTALVWSSTWPFV